MFGKRDFVDNLSRDLTRARDKRDALASHVTTLTAQITELEARLSEENYQRERERVVGKIEEIKERLRDFYLAFAHAVAGMRDARLNDVTIEHQVDRDVVQLRLTWEKARFDVP